MNIRELLNDYVQHAMTSVGIPAECSPLVAQGKKAGFGDYQANGAMGAAKSMKSKPQDIAASIVEALEKNTEFMAIVEKLEIAGPGFINIHLSPVWLAKQAQSALSDEHLGIQRAEKPQTVVVDYSAPNLAKEMHVGHLRSSIIGDAQVRLMEFLGHKVIRQNHIGDWGTQFGMLIAELEEVMEQGSDEIALKDLEVFYQQSKKHFDESESFADKAREYVVKLQSGDEGILKLWQRFIGLSLSHSEDIYKKLNVKLTREDVQGESAYNDDLPVLMEELIEKKIAVEDQSAMVVFLEDFADKDGKPGVMIVQKKGGGYLYSTTDLAAVRYRHGTLKADRVLIYTDARQILHFKQMFSTARRAGFAPDSMELTHCPFGMVLGQDGKPFKTRTGGLIKLSDLLDEAIERAEKKITEKTKNLSSEEIAEVARKVGIGAVKYADLSKTRTNDYVFNWDAMLSFEGNTSPYLQYAYTRIRSIFRKAEASPESLAGDIILSEDQEKLLALKLLQFEEVVSQVSKEALPHMICTYLYELASLYMTFYEACPILKDDVKTEIRNSRLQLCALVANTLKTGLDLLGIEVMERM